MKLIQIIYQYDSREELDKHQIEMQKQGFRWVSMKSKILYDGKHVIEVEYMEDYYEE